MKFIAFGILLTLAAEALFVVAVRLYDKIWPPDNSFRLPLGGANYDWVIMCKHLATCSKPNCSDCAKIRARVNEKHD